MVGVNDHVSRFGDTRIIFYENMVRKSVSLPTPYRSNLTRAVDFD